MQPSGILEAALYTDDLAAAEAFYTGVLGLEVLGKVEGRHVFFRCGAGVVLVFAPRATAVPPSPDAKLAGAAASRPWAWASLLPRERG